jgi:hypothetical protein
VPACSKACLVGHWRHHVRVLLVLQQLVWVRVLEGCLQVWSLAICATQHLECLKGLVTTSCGAEL